MDKAKERGIVIGKAKVGETNYNKQGYLMTIVEILDRDKILIEFDDEYKTRTSNRYTRFLNGLTHNKNHLKSKRIGETRANYEGYPMKIVDYNDANNITIEFQDEHKALICTSYSNFQRRDISNPYHKSVLGIGYYGQGKYVSKIELKHTEEYKVWRSMLKRCRNDNPVGVYPTYIACEICPEWLNFQTFAKWYEENYYKCDNEVMNLDKDILFKRNKLYSPNTCIFVPQSINKIFTKRESCRGEYPIGVRSSKSGNYFYAALTRNTKRVSFGSFNTVDEAFSAYKTAKEQYIKEVADKYKDKIPLKLYKALYKYEVEITD